MKTNLCMKMTPALVATALAGIAPSQATILAWESFGGVTDGGNLNGYAGTDGVTETGLTGTWSAVDNNHSTKARPTSSGDFTPRSIVGGHSVDEIGGNIHFIESANWGVDSGTRSLGQTVDLSMDGTYYMSFWSQAGGNDSLLQIGLSNGTNELMWGNAYGGGSPTQGITAYFQALSTTANTTNANGTYMDPGDNGTTYGGWETAFWVARLEKTNSGTTNDLTVNIVQYNIEDSANPGVIDVSDPASWSRVVALSGVDGTFTDLRFKQSGGSGQFPGMDEFLLGESWMDVTGVVPEPSVALLGGLGLLGLLRRRR